MKVWYQLVDATTGKSYRNSTPDKVTVDSDADIGDFRKEVKTENADDLLRGISPSLLKVFKNMADLDSGTSLMNSLGVSGMGMSEGDPLLVMVPQSASATTPTTCTSFYRHCLLESC